MSEFERFHAAVPAGSTSLTLRVDGPGGAGVEFERLAIEPARPMRVTAAVARSVPMPVVPGHVSSVGEVTVVTEGALNPITVERLEVNAVAPSQAVVASSAAGFGDALVHRRPTHRSSSRGCGVEAGTQRFSADHDRVTGGRVRPGAEVALGRGLSAVISGASDRERGARTAGGLLPAPWLAGSRVTALAMQAIRSGARRSPNFSSRSRRALLRVHGSACSEGSDPRRGPWRR